MERLTAEVTAVMLERLRSRLRATIRQQLLPRGGSINVVKSAWRRAVRLWYHKNENERTLDGFLQAPHDEFRSILGECLAIMLNDPSEAARMFSGGATPSSGEDHPAPCLTPPKHDSLLCLL